MAELLLQPTTNEEVERRARNKRMVGCDVGENNGASGDGDTNMGEDEESNSSIEEVEDDIEGVEDGGGQAGNQDEDEDEEMDEHYMDDIINGAQEMEVEGPVEDDGSREKIPENEGVGGSETVEGLGERVEEDISQPPVSNVSLFERRINRTPMKQKKTVRL